MSNTSFMEKLLEGVEVEWQALGELARHYSLFGFRDVRVPECKK